MKKTLILSAAILAFAGLTISNASAQNQDPTTTQAQQEQKTAVKLSDLPAPVKTTLTADLFKSWVPSAAFLVKDTKAEYYLIEVKKGEETKSVKIDKGGKIVE